MTAWLTRRVDARPLAYVRVAVGIAALLLAPETATIFAYLINSPSSIRLPVCCGESLLTPFTAGALIAVWLLGVLALCAGFHARWAALLVSLSVAGSMLVEQQAYSNHLVLLAVLAALLALAEGARGASDSPTVPAWPVFLIQTQITSMYLFAGLAKLTPDFLSGHVLAVVGRPGVVAQVGTAGLVYLAYATVAAELLLPALLWLPRLRVAAWPAGLLLHVGMVVVVQDPGSLIPFALLSLAPYALFPGTAPALLARGPIRPRGPGQAPNDGAAGRPLTT